METFSEKSIKKFAFKFPEQYGDISGILGTGTYGTVFLRKPSKRFTSLCKEESKEENELVYAEKNCETDEKVGYCFSFIREITILKFLASTSNPYRKYIIDPKDVYLSHGSGSMILEVAQGNLHNLIISLGHYGFSSEEIRNIAADIVKAIIYMHSYGIIHRDLKPANILYCHKGNKVTFKNHPDRAQIKLADFGISRFSKSKELPFTVGVFTTYYRPPEVFLGGAYDEKSDVWALGCLLAEIHTGQPLFCPATTLTSDRNIMLKIISLLGPINKEVWPNCENLPNYEDTYGSKLVEKKKSLSKLIKNKSLRKMLKRCFTLDPAKRPTIFELAEDPYFEITDEYQDPSPLDRLYLVSAIGEKEHNQESSYPKEYLGEKRRKIMHILLTMIERIGLEKKSLASASKLLDRYMSISEGRSDEGYIDNFSFEEQLFINGLVCTMIMGKKDGSCFLEAHEVCKKLRNDRIYITEMELLKYEIRILKATNFDLHFVTAYDFLHVHIDSYPYMKMMTKEMLNMMLLTEITLYHRENVVALASIYLVNIFNTEGKADFFVKTKEFIPVVSAADYFIDNIKYVTYIPAYISMTELETYYKYNKNTICRKTT